MTVNEAGAALGLRPVTVRQHIKNGLIEATYNDYARRWEIEPSEVERYQQERKRAGRPKKGE